MRTRTRLGLGEAGDGPRLRIAVHGDPQDARRRARELGEFELTGPGLLVAETGLFVLHADAGRRDATAIGGAVAAAAARLAFLQALSQEDTDRLGYGFLCSALAHEAAKAVGDARLHPVVRGSTREPLLAFGGDPVSGCRGLLARGRLPRLADVLATEASDFDPEQHAFAFAFVAWLGSAAAAPTTGVAAPAATPPLAALLAKARDGEAAAKALSAVLRADLAAVESRFLEFVRLQKEPNWPKPHAPLAVRSPHPHAALYAYVREPVPERHRAVVKQALAMRAAELTSGFADDDGRPRVALGPVNVRTYFWHGDERSKQIDRAWPFVVVLEYDPVDAPEAVLECFRRVRGRKDDDGWMIDPGQGFVEHHNAQIATARGDRFAYLAIPDTPTGTRIAESEFVHRARVRWKDGREAVLGLRTVLEAFSSASTEGWSAAVEPLVDWRVAASSDALGVTATTRLDDLGDELSPFATKRVFNLPEVPVGLRVGR